MAALVDANDLAYDDLTNSNPTEGNSDGGWRTFQPALGPGSTYTWYIQLAGHETLQEFPELVGGVVFGWG